MGNNVASLIPVILLLGMGSVSVHAADRPNGSLYSCQFTAGSWSRADWVRVKTPRAERFGDWNQHDDCLVNQVPAGVVPGEYVGKLSDTYSSMVYKEKLAGNLTISSTMAFACTMAPLIVLAPELTENAQGQKEYREHFEIVIFNQGVNVWHHFVQDGKLTYRKAAFASFPLEKDTKYTLVVKKTGKTLTVSVAGHTFGYLEEALPDAVYVGITGCEGLNRFYDFTLQR
jgi:hypothetical protein